MTSDALIGDSVTMINPWKMLTWLFVTQVFVAFVGRSLAPLGLLIGEDLLLTKAQIGMLPAALFLGQSIASIPAGFVTDLLGSKRLLLMLTVCLGLSFLLMTLTSAFVVVLALITIGGIGYGTMHPVTNRGVLFWFTSKQRGTAMGIKQMGITFGSALSALLLLPLAGVWGWRMALFVACLLLIVAGILAFLFYHDPPRDELDERENKKQTRFLTSIWSMFKNKPLLLVSLSALGLSGGQMVLNTYIVLFAFEWLGFSLFLSGVLLVISEVSGSFGRVAWGIISDRLFQGKRMVVLIIIAVFTVIASLTLALIPSNTSFYIMALITVFFGFCMSGFNGIWMNTVTELVPREQSGIASGFSITLSSWGVIIVPPLYGLIVDTTGMYASGWLFLAFIMAFVIVLLLFTMRMIHNMPGNKM